MSKIKPLNIKWLFDNKFIELTEKAIYKDFIIFRKKKSEFTYGYIGEYVTKGKIHGFGKAVDELGNIYLGSFDSEGN